VLEYLGLYGTALDSTNMKDFKRVSLPVFFVQYCPLSKFSEAFWDQKSMFILNRGFLIVECLICRTTAHNGITCLYTLGAM